jgi:hypothetical protein
VVWGHGSSLLKRRYQEWSDCIVAMTSDSAICSACHLGVCPNRRDLAMEVGMGNVNGHMSVLQAFFRIGFAR